MKPFTYTPSAKRSAGFAHANAKAKAAHESSQARFKESDRSTYAVPDEVYAHAELDAIGDSHYAQMLESAGEAKWDFVLAVAATKDNPSVAAALAELEAAVAAAQA